MPVEVVARFDSPGRGPVGLAWDGRHLWQADFREGLIYQLNDTAEIIGTLRCPGNLGGLTWDGRSLWQALYEEGVCVVSIPLPMTLTRRLTCPAKAGFPG
ncbi:MAG: hypothetical protein R3C44_15965 [Chloroflexota bacterium]